jgi:anti-sigma B factor antagonist
MSGWWSHVPIERLPVLWIGQAAVVTLPAEIDVTDADRIREYLLAVVNQGAAVLIADLSMTTFCDSAGVQALLRAFRRAEASECAMRLVITTAAVARIMAITGVDRLLDIYPNVAAALAGPDAEPGQDDRVLDGNPPLRINRVARIRAAAAGARR